MSKQADYIKRIEIKGIWGWKNIAWDLRPDVNILSGINGIGKSTIVNQAVHVLHLLSGGELDKQILPENVRFVFSPEDASYIRFDVIRSFARPLLNAGLMQKVTDVNVRTELDWQLYRLQRRYLDYQVNIGNRIIELLTGGKPEAVRKRYEGLGIKDVYLGAAVKTKEYNELLQKYSLKPEEVLYMGDDIPDYEVLQLVGLPCCPADAAPEIKAICKYISHRNGGYGCGRDVIEQVRRAQGKWMSHQEAFGW